MEKLIRFALIVFFSAILYIMLYSIVPCIAFIFGGDFLAVAQHPAYVIGFGLLLIPIIIGDLLNDSFDKEFLPKH